ncbi:helix-turn-helix domain-containing protein [Corynebacterium glutamicum]|uniref:helix-turn-helix domain-containing protein n=1 Tax=Corynebacterium glutamicum TaxID=1718 RepID=UPI001B8C5F3F|nr:helix-turn-helix domain-containing protein [Corynebacterium glutamicum]
MTNFDGWLTSDQAAEYIGCHPETMRKRLRAGDLKSVKFGQTYRTTREWCDRFMLAQAA